MAVFEPTTLLTFLFNAPLEARVVELLGSWDNFSRPYRMHHDRQRGKGTWSGCFKFDDIVFDGDRLHWRKPRSGGLKQGGKYWYYYRLNDEVEAYDDGQACTTDCPLLPGQTVNVMEVPVEVVEPFRGRCRSASADFTAILAGLKTLHTLDPGHKFLPLDPPPLSRVHGRCISDLALGGRLGDETLFSRQSLLSSFKKLPIQDREKSSCVPRSKRTCFDHRARLSPRQSRRLASPMNTRSSAAKGNEAEAAGRLAKSRPLIPRPLSVGGSTSRSDAGSTLIDSLHPHSQILASAATSDAGISVSIEQSRPEDIHGQPEDAAHAHAHFDLCSPSFSAATVSSGGLNTPFRLSGSCPLDDSTNNHEQQLTDVTCRLRALDVGGRSPSGGPHAQHFVSRALREYALPTPVVESAQISGTRLSRKAGLAPESFLADEILSELGYLGGSIS